MAHLKHIGAQYHFEPGKYYEYVDKKIIPMSMAEYKGIYDPERCVLIDQSSSWEKVKEYLK